MTKSVIRFWLTGLVFVLAGIFSAVPLDASTPMNVRATGMGETLLSSDYDASALFINPAVLGKTREWQAASCFGKPWIGLPGLAAMGAGYLIVGAPLDFADQHYGGVGLGYGLFQAEGLIREQTFALGYGIRLWDMLQIGVSGKYLFRDYLIGGDPLASLDPVFDQGSSAAGIALDAGMVLDLPITLGPEYAFQWGCAARNLNQPDLGLVLEDKIPLEIQTGLGWKYLPWEVRVAVDIFIQTTESELSPEPLRPNLGVEKILLDKQMALRLGWNPDEITFGFGFDMNPWLVEYSLECKLNLLADNYQSHKIGLSWRLENIPAKTIGAPGDNSSREKKTNSSRHDQP